MYIFVSPKHYNLYGFHLPLHREPNKLQHNISRAITILRQLGGKIYHVDQNSFARISKLKGNDKIKFLDSSNS